MNIAAELGIFVHNIFEFSVSELFLFVCSVIELVFEIEVPARHKVPFTRPSRRFLEQIPPSLDFLLSFVVVRYEQPPFVVEINDPSAILAAQAPEPTVCSWIWHATKF